MKIDMEKLKDTFERYEKQAAEDLIDRCSRRAREHQIENIARKAHGYPEGDMEWELRFYSGGM